MPTSLLLRLGYVRVTPATTGLYGKGFYTSAYTGALLIGNP